MQQRVQRAAGVAVVAAALRRVRGAAPSLLTMCAARSVATTWWPTSEHMAAADAQAQARAPSSSSPADGAQEGNGTAAASALPPCRGVVQITAQNLSSELATRVPVLLYFMLTTHTDVNAYTLLLCRHVDQLNRRLQAANMAEAYDEHGADAGLAVKLAVVDCATTPDVARRFAVHPNAFPVIYFMYKGVAIDRLVGIVAEAQVTESLDAFVAHAKEQTRDDRDVEAKKRQEQHNNGGSSSSSSSGSGGGGGGASTYTTTASSSGSSGSSGHTKLRQPHDRDDENAVTLLTAAHDRLQKKQLAKAKELFAKALDYATREMDIVKTRYGVAHKKMTRELSAKLRSESCYHTVPSALCGLAMTALAGKDHDEARKYVQRVHDDYPYAVHELRDVATAVARVEIVVVAKYDVDSDNYVTLMRSAPADDDEVRFYRRHLKLVAAFFFEGAKRNALEECLRLIRSEPKMLAALKEGGVVPRDLVLGARAQTPARTLMQHMLDALGPIDEDAMLARRLLQQYT